MGGRAIADEINIFIKNWNTKTELTKLLDIM
jgi:hypothetical protein